jgi:type VI protein secretion system component Hcp
MKKLLFAIIAIPFVVFISSSRCLAACDGDFNCNGVVDGLDLVKFADNFGKTDCGSNIYSVIGSVLFDGLGEVDLRSLRFALHQEGGPSSSKAEFDDIKILIAADGELTPQLNLMTAKGEVLPEVTIFYSGNELIKLQSVFITNLEYLPPVASGDPFLLDISLNFGKIFFSWEDQEVNWDVVSNKGDSCNQDNFRLINLIGYAGPIEFPGFIPITAFNFAMAKEQTMPASSRAVFEAVEIISAVVNASVCLFGKTASGADINEITIEKWGATFDRFPEARIELEKSYTLSFAVYTTATGDLEQKTAFSYSKIRWTHWGGPDPENPQEYTSGWSVDENIPF